MQDHVSLEPEKKKKGLNGFSFLCFPVQFVSVSEERMNVLHVTCSVLQQHKAIAQFPRLRPSTNDDNT